MNCPTCEAANPDQAKFCMNCGNALSFTCSNCGEASPPQAKFCSNCGHALAGDPTDPAHLPQEAARTAGAARFKRFMPKELRTKLESARATGRMQGERRVVTILFCDVEGSTAAAAKLDPEEWTEIMNGAFESLISPVYRYEGTVARLMGDAVLAFFGAPIAHEDDPERAIRAGLEIVQGIRPYREQVKDRYGVDFDIRVGINTGLVVIGEVGTDLAVEYTAMGDAVNLASRMEQTAQSGTVQVSGDTYKRVAQLFEFEDLGGVQVKGRSEPVQSYRVLRSKTRPRVLRGIEGLESPLIGRTEEMATLQKVIAEVREGRGSIVSVMGEAGLGKSRLLTELHDALASEGLLASNGKEPSANRDGGPQPAMGWCEGRSLSYETATPYAPFVDLLGSYFDLLPEKGADDNYERIRQRIAEFMPEGVADTAPYLATMLDIPLSGEALERVRHLMGPPALRMRIFQATCDLVQRMAETHPLVLVFDDVHWMDPTSLDLLEELVGLTDRVGLVVVALFRPRRDEPSWHFHEKAARDYAHRYIQIPLNPLDEDRSRELVANLLHVEDLPETVRGLILKKAEGNPFYVEEVIRSLLDSGLVIREDSRWRATRAIEDIAVPDTLAGVITARLDRLDEGTKRVAQAASVIGRQFDYDTLAEVHGGSGGLDQALVELQRRELIREKSGGLQRVYMFKHAMTQQTAYSSLLRRDCNAFHLRAAEYLERASHDQPGEVARHFHTAGERVRALPFMVEAADRAARAYATKEAIDTYSQALEILDTAADLILTRRVHEGLGSALTFAGDMPGAVGTYRKMIQIAEENSDDPMRVSALNKLGFVTGILMEQFPEAQTALAEAEQLARESEDLAGLAELHMVKCGICTATGDLDGAIGHLGESTELGREMEAEEPLLFGLTHSANTLTFMTRYEEAWELSQEALQQSERLGNRRFKAEILTFPIAWNHLRNGDLEAARQAAREGLELASQIGAAAAEWTGAYSLGQIHRLLGEYEAAIAYNQRALGIGQAFGAANTQMVPLCALASLHLEISEGFRDQIAEHRDQILHLLEQPSGLAWGAAAWAELGFSLWANGDLDQAEDFFQKGLTLPTTLSHLLRPQLLAGAALLELDRQALDQAEQHIAEAWEYAESRRMKYYFPLIALVEAQVKAARGEVELALETYARAEDWALEMGMRPRVWLARDGAARLLIQADRTDEANTKRREAEAMLDEIGDLFEDEDLRKRFVESAKERSGRVPWI